MARVITAVGEWEPPALVGLCEVENDTVLRDLTRRSPLKELNYRYVMTDSPDLRGIDVALLYQRDLFKLLSFRSVSIPPLKQFRPTRDLLHVSGFATDRRHTGRICLPLAKSFRRSKRIRTVPPSCSPNTVHRG